jgi:hypothetical protein
LPPCPILRDRADGEFVPLHIAIWNKFPVWYHLTFLLTIIPAVLVGALLPALGNKDLNEGYSAPR